MPVFRRTLEVARPVEDVFAFIGDFANTAQWDPGVASATQSAPGAIGVGTTFDLRVLFNGKELPMTYRVTAWEPPLRVELRGEGARSTAVDDIRCIASPQGGTTISYSADLRLRGVFRILEPLFKKKFTKTADDAMAGMQTALEALTPRDPS